MHDRTTMFCDSMDRKNEDISLDPSNAWTERISFTFRRIDTFVDQFGRIIGQGSPFKTVTDAAEGRYEAYLEHAKIADCSEDEAASVCKLDLIKAFSKENKQHHEFDWNSIYKRGFLI